MDFVKKQIYSICAGALVRFQHSGSGRGVLVRTMAIVVDFVQKHYNFFLGKKDILGKKK